MQNSWDERWVWVLYKNKMDCFPVSDVKLEICEVKNIIPMTKIIDFHAHIYPDDVAEKLVPKMEEIYGVKRRHNATLSSLLASANDGDIDKVVVLPVANRPEHAKLNTWYAGLKEKSDKIIPFGSLHPQNDPNELDSFPELGLKGIKFQPNAQLFYPDDGKMFKFYRKASELDLIVVFHAGDEEGGVRGEYSQPEKFIKVLQSFPGLKIVLPHLGGFKTWDKLDLVLGYENVYYDTAHLPGNIDDGLLLNLIDKIGIEKVIYGTDFPWSDHREDKEHIEKLLGSKAQKIFWDNPKTLLGLDC